MTEFAGKRLIRKKLDEDCLLSGQLHPSIRERLARIRELAHPQVATLHGVEKDGEDVFLVWEYVDGERWDARARDEHLRRDLKRAVELLHERGIVHGSLRGGNIFVKDDRVILTDVSPLLFSDPADDLTAVAKLLGENQPERRTAQTSLWNSKTRSLAAALVVVTAGIAFSVGIWNWWQHHQSAGRPVPIARGVVQ